MSDFLCQVPPTSAPQDGLRALQDLFQPEQRSGWSRRTSSHSLAAVRDLIGPIPNWRESGDLVVAWIGDLPGIPRILEAATRECLALIQDNPGSAESIATALARGQLHDHFDGSGVVVLSTAHWLAVLTDPMAGVQVYVGRDPAGKVRAVGSHADLVADAAGRSDQIDLVSVGDYLDTGTPCCPFTVYEGVTELEPGHVLVITREADAKASWWTPPREEPSIKLDEAAEAFVTSWRSAVERRCSGNRIAVQLSGGMDSRAVMAAIPKSIACAGLTFGDEINREAKISALVAASYGREWKFLKRDPEYLAKTAAFATRFTGCEGEWHHAHAIGLLPEFRDRGFSDVFTGLFMDNNFKGYYADDIVSVQHARGWLPPTFRRRPMDYVAATSPWSRATLLPQIQEARTARRRAFYERHFAKGRQSEWEWLDGHPVSQASDNTGWFVERRLIPLRLPVYDRALVDLAFRVPALKKAGGQFFGAALTRLLGPSGSIPNANDGSRPASSPGVQHVQRLVRKAQRMVRDRLESIGLRGTVQHSWHDYRHYWNTSPIMRELIREHRGRLAQFASCAHPGALERALEDTSLPWRVSYRLLQLCLWTAQ
ncbi:MAG: hypothetical protein IT581_05460 [Verrucomicrobiales bacterium]|nr:hypothetical protein [Verrucomicrobiales bacterium]